VIRGEAAPYLPVESSNTQGTLVVREQELERARFSRTWKSSIARPSAAVNAFIIYDLARRAERPSL